MQKDEEIFRLKLQMQYLQEYIVEVRERENQFIEREKQISNREVESRARQK